MTAFVVDSSVALKWYVTEADSDKALGLVRETVRLSAPGLIWAELGNAVWKNIRIGNTDAEVWGRVRANLPAAVEIVNTPDECLNLALQIAVEAVHPIYDCIYLALAIQTDARVVTVDKRFLGVFAKSEHSERVISLAAAVEKL